jgi:lysophospholipase L1-like esterase
MCAVLAFAFTNSPMEDELVHHATKFPVFGTEPTDAELEALGSPASAQDPRIASHGYYPDSPKEWLAHHRAILRDEASQPWQIVFLGDSITQGWLKTQEWNEYFKPKGAFNMGIGGDRTSQLLWRIEHGELDHVRPKVVVLMIGTNNMWADFEKYGAQAVADGTERVLLAIQHKLPNAKILLLDVPPMLKDPEHAVRGRIRAVNEATEHLADGNTVIRVPVGQVLLEEGGQIDPSIMSDFVHPTAIGYTKIAKILRPAVESLL